LLASAFSRRPASVLAQASVRRTCFIDTEKNTSHRSESEYSITQLYT